MKGDYLFELLRLDTHQHGNMRNLAHAEVEISSVNVIRNSLYDDDDDNDWNDEWGDDND